MNFINKYTCNSKQLPRLIMKLKRNKISPIIDYVNENKDNDIYNYFEIKKNIYKFNKNYFALKLSSFNINYNKNMAMIKTNIIIDYAIKQNSKIVIDAEQHSIQNKIDYVSDYFMIKYNKDDVNVYKTYQIYKKNGLKDFKEELKSKRDYYIGFKLVRGAYLNEDKKKGVLCDSYKEVNKNYDEAISEFVKHSRSKDRLMCATHNYNSICHARSLIDEKNKDKIEFAQLMGMSDNITQELVENNYKVFKYLPYGNLWESIPYLLRRLYENNSMIKYL